MFRDIGAVESQATQSRTGSVVPEESFPRAWSAYIRGNVVSDHAARLISSMLTKTMARNDDFAPEEGADEADKTDLDDDIPALTLTPALARGLFRACGTESTGEASGDTNRKRGRADHTPALALAQNLWGQQRDLASAQLDDGGPMHAGRVREHILARAAVEATDELKPYSAKTLPTAELFGSLDAASMHRWLDSLCSGAEPPTHEQRDFLLAIIQQIEKESLAEQAGGTEPSGDEPLFDVVHGVPGEGKSKLIGWLRGLFEQVLHWTHSVEFVCLAFQNAMAALIGGFAVHHWTDIPVGDADGTATTRDNNKLASKC